MAVFCLKNFHSRFLLFINALPLKEQTDCANGEKTRSTPSHPQALVQEDGNVALGVLPKDRPTSQSEMVAACTVCGFNGIIADHLRLSKECLKSLRREPQLRMKASEVVFIVKASLMLTAADPVQCPAEECPGGPHCALPPSCLLWWEETGWTLMGWSGSSTRATSEIVHHKISQFRKNLRLRNRGTADLTSSIQEGSQVEQQGGPDGGLRYLCEICSFQGSLVNHLLGEEACLSAHLRRHLPHRVRKYKGRPRLAVFDLGIVARFCSNPDCEGDLERDGLSRHLRGACLHYYQTVGQELFQWGENPSPSTIEAKMKNRKSTIKAQLREEADITAFQHELGRVLK